MTRDSAVDATGSELRDGLRRRTLSEATYTCIQQLAEQYRRDASDLQGFADKKLALRLIYHAHRLVVRDPAKAEIVGFVAQQVAANLPSPTIAEAARVSLLEGKAWYEYAAALLRLGRYHDARAAVERARAFFSLPIVVPKIRDEDARLNLIYGQVLHFLGKSEAGLKLIDRAADELLYICDDAKQYVKARTIHATLLMRLDRFEEALELLDRVAESAAEEDDEETLAHITVNIAFCAAKLGDDARAEECLKLATAMFEELDMRSELPRTRGALVQMLKRHGRVPEAISEMYKTRNDYLALRMPLVAARFSMEIADALMDSGRFSEAQFLCSTAVRAFARARLLREARRALNFLRRCATEGRLTRDHVAAVRQFLDVLSADDTAVFEPKAS